LLITPLILLNINFLMDLPIFCILGGIREEWNKRKCKGWNGREGPTFTFGGPTDLLTKIVTLFTKCGIGSWTLIWTTHCTFSLDFKNALLSKCDSNSLMFFPCFFCWILFQWTN
jgi:hypothetical protein